MFSVYLNVVIIFGYEIRWYKHTRIYVQSMRRQMRSKLFQLISQRIRRKDLIGNYRIISIIKRAYLLLGFASLPFASIEGSKVENSIDKNSWKGLLVSYQSMGRYDVMVSVWVYLALWEAIKLPCPLIALGTYYRGEPAWATPNLALFYYSPNNFSFRTFRVNDIINIANVVLRGEDAREPYHYATLCTISFQIIKLFI